MNPYNIIDLYYAPGSDLYDILVKHSQCVCNKALDLAQQHPILKAELSFVKECSMLHDIGIFMTNAPGIHCHGTHAYIEHGYLGGQLLRSIGYPLHARVCERHTGAGISVQDIVCGNLPLPHRDMRPETLVEQLICFSDKFYSKSHLDEELSVEQIQKKLAKFGDEQVERFNAWLEFFHVV